jgi:hypothetical protein
VGRSAVIAVFVIAQLTAQAALGVQTARAATVAMKDGVLYYRAAPGEQNSIVAGLNDRPSLHVRMVDTPDAESARAARGSPKGATTVRGPTRSSSARSRRAPCQG